MEKVWWLSSKVCVEQNVDLKGLNLDRRKTIYLPLS